MQVKNRDRSIYRVMKTILEVTNPYYVIVASKSQREEKSRETLYKLETGGGEQNRKQNYYVCILCIERNIEIGMEDRKRKEK